MCQAVWINVTDFFRDPAVWEHLRDQTLPDLLARRPAGAPLRIWSAGCATGQEPYSLALLLAEALGLDGLDGRVEIRATDVDSEALGYGKHGVYSKWQMAAVSSFLREKYFVAEDKGWQVRDELRRVVRFCEHNLLQPWSPDRFDLILCRNTLLYFRPEAQGQVLARLRRSLAHNGCLLLGRSEIPIFHDASRSFAERFMPANLKNRLYKAGVAPERETRDWSISGEREN